MRIHAVGSIVCVILAATLVSGGGTPKERPFNELENSDIDTLFGDWEAAITTKDGWQGTLHGKVSIKRDHPEDSHFHAFLALKYDLTLLHKKTKKVVATASGAERIELIPWEKDRQRYLQLLRDFQMQQKVFLLDLLEVRPDDKKAQKQLADLVPSKRDTAAFWVVGNTWTLDVAPIVLEFLPKKASTGQNIDWDARIVWKKIKSK
jgi:hypothetical protein